MQSYSLTHVADHTVMQGVVTLHQKDRGTTAALLAHLAEADARKLYLPLGYTSMQQYCVAELHASEDMSSKRIRAARAAREFPAIFHAVADGRESICA